MENIIRSISRESAQELKSAENEAGKIPQDLIKDELERDWVNQFGSYDENFYTLLTPPKFLIFYVKEGRTATETINGCRADAEEEKRCVETYCKDKNIPFITKMDPTSEDVKSGISSALAEETLSGLIVFVMAHGIKGAIRLSDADVTIEEIIAIMAERHPHMPKV